MRPLPRPDVELVGGLTASPGERLCQRVVDEDRIGTRRLQHLGAVLDEEWHHDWFANRDLDRLA